MASLAQIQDVPPGDLVLLAGPPGSGKSTFCQQAVLGNTERRLNGFYSAVKDQHVRETRCIAMGDPCCEWEFR